MKTSAAEHHAIMQILVSILFLFLFPGILNLVEAQWDPPPPPENNSSIYNSNRFTPYAAIIVVILVAALVFMTCFSTYVRNRSTSSEGDTAPTTASLTSHGTVARGLDASVIETFPTFSYSEVKDHKIRKGALECAVCLNEFKVEETLRLIPKCDHVFHPECIDAWLGSHVTCPVCRADLVPKPGDKPVLFPVLTDNNVSNDRGIVERSGSRSGEVFVQVDEDEGHQEPRLNRNLSFDDYANRLRKAWSSRKFGLGKFRSHSTGHSPVQPGENLERFTLKLPTHVRNEVIQRATLDRAKSCTVVLPREGSLRCGYRSDKSNQTESVYQRIGQWSGRRAKSVQWNFFTRGFSMKSPKGVETHQESTSKGNESRAHARMPSFNCLEPKAIDEVGLFLDDQLVKSLV